MSDNKCFFKPTNQQTNKPINQQTSKQTNKQIELKIDRYLLTYTIGSYNSSEPLERSNYLSPSVRFEVL